MANSIKAIDGHNLLKLPDNFKKVVNPTSNKPAINMNNQPMPSPPSLPVAYFYSDCMVIDIKFVFFPDAGMIL